MSIKKKPEFITDRYGNSGLGLNFINPGGEGHGKTLVAKSIAKIVQRSQPYVSSIAKNNGWTINAMELGATRNDPSGVAVPKTGFYMGRCGSFEKLCTAAVLFTSPTMARRRLFEEARQ